MDINLKWRLRLFQNTDVITLFQKILERFSRYGLSENFVSIFIYIPQKDDIEFIKKNYHFTNPEAMFENLNRFCGNM